MNMAQMPRETRDGCARLLFTGATVPVPFLPGPRPASGPGAATGWTNVCVLIATLAIPAPESGTGELLDDGRPGNSIVRAL
jgi:hypothetical protein